METCYELCVNKLSRSLVEAPKIMTARRQEKKEREGIPRVKSPLKLREPVGDMIIPVTPMPTVT